MTTSHNAHGDISDVSLMLRVSESDADAFAVLYRRHFRRVLDFFYAMSRDRQSSEDLCQETFLRLWRLRERYASSGSFPAYLFAVARFVWMERRTDVYRQSAIRPLEEGEGGGMTTPSESAPDVLAERSELSRSIADAVAALPEEQRMAFVLRAVQGLTLDEIAAAMACPINTVRSRKLLAFKKLRETLRGLLVL